jgi:hypothetical protein
MVEELLGVATSRAERRFKEANAGFFLCHFSWVIKELFVLYRGCVNSIISIKRLILFSLRKLP